MEELTKLFQKKAVIENSNEKVEQILSKRTSGPTTEYLVKWKDSSQLVIYYNFSLLKKLVLLVGIS